MSSYPLLILTADDVKKVLFNREHAIMEMIKYAYVAHRRGGSSLPQSVFLRFPGNSHDRIIALPAYVNGDIDAAGIKWIASFPGNVAQGLDRASATIILNSTQTGQPLAVMEGSIISAQRTAASAALAAAILHRGESTRVALIGCGVINFEILRFLQASFPDLTHCIVYDLSIAHAEQFRRRALETFPLIDVLVAHSLEGALDYASLVSFATTAGTPYIDNPSLFVPGSTVLHVSLRDLSPRVILSACNVVDDIEHVSRAQTSIHLTAEQQGNHDFIRCTLADILDGAAPAHHDDERPVIFSPFGLGVLDLALARDVYDHAYARGCGAWIANFLPRSWQRHEALAERAI